MSFIDVMLMSLVVVVMSFHVVYCPFTKVEESFNVQAMHDIIFHGLNLSEYDHHEFPGVVPRTFIGPLSIVSLSYPVVLLLQWLSAPKLFVLISVRLCLGILVALSLMKFCSSVCTIAGQSTSRLLLVFTVSQFHVLFYSSRPLPNTFALVLVLLAVSAWLDGSNFNFVFWSASAIIIFRVETAILLGLLLLARLISREISIHGLFCCCVVSGAVAMGVTVAVDSYFWRYWLWPEGQVAYYNVVLNKSSDWGTSPFLWYFYSALPRGTLTAFMLSPLCLFTSHKKVSVLYCASLLFVLLYSFLPHKELRFIIYVFPIINAAAAVGFENMRAWSKKKLPHGIHFANVLLVGCVCANILASTIFTHVSRWNYPGGFALQKLHSIETHTDLLSLHMDNLALQTGVSRFGQQNSNWSYSKADGLIYQSDEELSFSHLIRETPCVKYNTTHEILDTVNAFSGIRFQGLVKLPILRLEERLCILKRRSHS